MKNNNTQEYTIDFLHILNVLWKRLWIIVLTCIIVAGLAFSYAKFILTPQYAARTLIYVNNSDISLGGTNFSISSSEITAAQSLVETYIVILKTRTTLNEVITRAGVELTYDELVEMVDAESVNSTEIFRVTVTTDSPELSAHLANTIAEVLPEKISNVVDGSSVRIVDYAVTPINKVSPSVTKYTALGLIIGLLLSCAGIIIYDALDDVIRDEEYLIQNFDIPILAVIPDLETEVAETYQYRSHTTQSDKKGE